MNKLPLERSTRGFTLYSGRISNCYDSHCHLVATGEIQSRLSLHKLKQSKDIHQLNPLPQNFIGEWLIGFGWDQSLWPNGDEPHRESLDQVFPHKPVVFSRLDGHVYWVNSEVLRRLGWLKSSGQLRTPIPHFQGGEVVCDDQGIPTGVFIDAAKKAVDALIPPISPLDMNGYLLAGIQKFHSGGFTHVRDMTCSEMQWNELLKLEGSGLLNLAIEQTFSAQTKENFDEALQLATRALKVPTKCIRPQALKVYYDGALGSEGALLSQNYNGSDSRGLKLLLASELNEMMIKAWELNLDIAVHAIGDQAAHEVSEVAVKIWDQGKTGRLHLEHAQMMRTDTIQMLKGRNVICHMQPCHWLSDKRWLKDKVGNLFSSVFPWGELQKNDVGFDFGSDSPISPPSLKDNLLALEDSKKQGVPSFEGEPVLYHSHQDTSWVPNSFSIFERGEAVETIFNGVTVFKKEDSHS